MQSSYKINIKQLGKNKLHKIFNQLNEVPALSPLKSFNLTLHERFFWAQHNNIIEIVFWALKLESDIYEFS